MKKIMIPTTYKPYEMPDYKEYNVPNKVVEYIEHLEKQEKQTIKELEEENKKLKEVQCTFCGTGCLKMREELQQRIDKAIEYIKQDYEKNQEVIEYCNFEDFYKRLLKILKGEENERE